MIMGGMKGGRGKGGWGGRGQKEFRIVFGYWNDLPRHGSRQQPHSQAPYQKLGPGNESMGPGNESRQLM